MPDKNNLEYGFPVHGDYVPPAPDVRDLLPRSGESHQDTQDRRLEIAAEMRREYPDGVAAAAAAANSAIRETGVKNPSDSATFHLPSVD